MKESVNSPANQLRRNLLASLPAFVLAPTALGQQGLVTPNPSQKAVSTAKREVSILPFALAGAWSDDFGGRSMLKMTLDISGSITFSGQATAYEEDQLRTLKIQIGAAVECIYTLAMSSSCSIQILYPQKNEPWFLKVFIGVSSKAKPPSTRGIAACSGIWARPNGSGAFDPAWNDQKVVESIAGLMIEFGVGVKYIANAKSAQCADALQALAKASPALAQKIGPASNWGAGTSIVLLGTASQDSTQGLMSSGRALQRGSLQAFAEGIDSDCFFLPPKVLEAAAVISKEAAGAVQKLVQLFDNEASEPLGVARFGKLIQPGACKPMPQCASMISFA